MSWSSMASRMAISSRGRMILISRWDARPGAAAAAAGWVSAMGQGPSVALLRATSRLWPGSGACLRDSAAAAAYPADRLVLLVYRRRLTYRPSSKLAAMDQD